MKGPEALRRTINMMSLNTPTAEDKVAIQSLLDIINLCLFTPIEDESDPSLSRKS
jgi:hypothetical protein